ncbi:MAG: Asp-tRNA(Asn)/Glu-tRNA(Gln) amidotransferase subunit GatC [Chloroflexi bacterium]|nr:Asp-tRNA(Asn)/Glu-tRNA(Gln) amidotransferase subunit GatC [Chloroflexota bacterium]
MSLTKEEVEHIATLARLDLTDDQKTLYRRQLSAILDYMAELRQLDTKDVPPTSGGGLSQMPLRADEIHPGLSTDALLKNAPQSEGDQFKIPPLFE